MENTETLKTSDMSMLSSAERRKIQKPLVEKKRRERMNGCLEELKEILINRDPRLRSHSSKLEKADILELTVERMKNDLNTMDHQILAKAYEDGYMECLDATFKFLARSGGQTNPHSAEIIKTHLLHDLQQRQTRINPVSSFGARFPSDGLNVVTAGIAGTPQQCLIQTNLPCIEASSFSLSKSHSNYRDFPLLSPKLHPKQTATTSKSRFLPYVKPTPLRELNQNVKIQARSSTSTNNFTFSGSNQHSFSSLSSSSLDVRKQRISKAVSPQSGAPKEEDVWRPF